MPFASQSQRGYMYSNHPKLAKEFEEETPKGADLPEHVQHFDEGTPSVGSDFDVDSGDTTTPVALTQTPPLPSAPPPTPPSMPPVAFNPLGSHPASYPPPPVISQASTVPSSSDDTSNYLNQQKASLSTFGPEQQMAVQNAILQRQRSPGSLVGQGLAGLGDAIMQGVARAGNPGFLSALQNRQDRQGEAQMGTMEKAQAGKLAQTQENMKLDAKNPSSSLSKIAQNSERPTLKRLGWSDDQINKTSAETIVDASKNSLTYADVQAQIGLKGQIAEQQADIQRQGLGIRGKEAETKVKALQAEHPVGGPLGAFLSNHFGGSAATNASTPSSTSMPQVGSVVQHTNGSYKFLGGDPSNKDSWSKI